MMKGGIPMDLTKLQNAIKQLYENESRSISYIAKLFGVTKAELAQYINDNKLEQKNVRIKPSTQKFINKNKQFILNELKNGETLVSIAAKLNTTTRILSNAIQRDEQLRKANDETKQYDGVRKQYTYPQIDKEDETWKTILGYETYEVSNQGRIRNKETLKILKPYPNVRTDYLYVMLYHDGKRKNLKVNRLVGHAFVDGYSEENNTINHINGNIYDDRAINLEWCSQSENNKHSYTKNNRCINRGGGPKYDKVIYNKDGKEYEFKTVRALAKFLGKSETQTHRLIKTDENIQTIKKS